MRRSRPDDGPLLKLADVLASPPVMLAVAYLSAVSGVVVYVVLDSGRGGPSQLALLLLVVALVILWRLSFRSAWG